jgi:hypothetical protein
VFRSENVTHPANFKILGKGQIHKSTRKGCIRTCRYIRGSISAVIPRECWSLSSHNERRLCSGRLTQGPGMAQVCSVCSPYWCISLLTFSEGPERTPVRQPVVRILSPLYPRTIISICVPFLSYLPSYLFEPLFHLSSKTFLSRLRSRCFIGTYRTLHTMTISDE